MAICGVRFLVACALQLTSPDDGGGLQENILQHESGISESCTTQDSILLLQEYLSTSMKIAAEEQSIDELATPLAETSVHTSTSKPDFVTDSNEATFDMDGLMSMHVPRFISVSKPSDFTPPRVPVEAVGSQQVASPIQTGLAPAMTGQTDAVSAAWTTVSKMLSTQQNLDVVEPSTDRVKQTPVAPFRSAQAAATLSARVALSLFEAVRRVTTVVVAKGAERVQSNPGLAVSFVVGAMVISSFFACVVLCWDNVHAPDGNACASKPEASTVDETEKRDNLSGESAIAHDGYHGAQIVFSEPSAAAPQRKPFVPPLNLGKIGFPEPTERAEPVIPSTGSFPQTLHGYDDDRPSMILGIRPSLSHLPRLRDWVQEQTSRERQDTSSSSKPSSQVILKAHTPHMDENWPSCDPRRMSPGPSLRSLAPQSGISPSPIGTQSSLASSQGHRFKGSQMRQAMAPPMPSVPSESFFQS